MADTVATLIVELAAKGDASVIASLKALDKDLAAADKGAREAQRSLATLKGDGGAGVLRLAQARARLQVASGDAAGAERTLANALAQTDRTSVATLGAQTQLVNVQNKLKASTSGVATAFSGLSGALATAGIGLGVSQVVSFGAAAVGAANSLEKTSATLRAVAGSQEAYDRIVAVATANQRLFGGTLEASLAPLQQFQFIANRTGASIEDLNRVAQLLATVNPAEGIAGAGFALSEAFSGDITSIVERFNLPRQAVRELVTESTSAAGTIQGLTALLAQQGVTAETLAAATNTNAAAYDRAGASISTLTTSLGGLISAGLAPAARGLTVVADNLNVLVQATQTAAGGISAQSQAIAASGATYEEYVAQATAAATAAAQQTTSIASGIPFFGQIAVAAGQAAASNQILSEAEYMAAQSALQHADAEAIRAATMQSSAAADLGGYAAASQYAQGQAEAEVATLNAAAANIEASYQSELLSQKQDELAAAIAGAAGTSGDATAAAAAIASAFGIEASEVIKLIGLHRELAAARAGKAGPGGGALGKGFGGTSAKDETAAVRAAINARVNLRGGVAAPAARGGGGGGGGGASAADKAAKAEQKAEEQRVKERERTLEKLSELEQSYGEQQAQIREDFAERIAEASQEFGDQQIDDRRGFYRSLLDIEDQGLRQQASAQFEAAANTAAALAATKGADVAAAYEAEAAKVIAAQTKRQEEIAKLQKEGKDAEAQYLADLDKMDREAEQRKLDRIAGGADSLQSQQAEALTQAQEDYAAKQQDILGGTEGINEAERARLETLMAQTEQLRQQAALGGGGAGVAPAAGGAAATTTTTPADAPTAAGIGAVVTKLDELRGLIAALVGATDNRGIIGAVNGLRGSGTYLP